MKIFFQLLIVLVGAALGLVVGFALRQQKMNHASGIARVPRAESGVAPDSRSTHFPKRPRKTERSDDSPLTTKLARDLSMSSGITRWLYWLEALEQATPADCPRLAQLAKGKSTLVRLVGLRWAEMNPQHMFDTLLLRQGADFPGGELQRILFNEWSKRDLNAAIAALNKSEGSRAPESWRRSFAGSLFDNDPELGLRLMADWHIDNYGPQIGGITKWAAADPRHAAEFALAHPSGYATRAVMEIIGGEWAKTDPAGALGFALQQRGGFAPELAGAVLKSWTDRDLHAAADWLTKTDVNSRNRLAPNFVEGWAQYDGAGALKWCEENLTGITFANAAASLIKGTKDLPSAAELVNTMPPSTGRGEAATILMQRWLPDYGSDKRIPPEATAWLAQMDSETIRRVLEQTQFQWSESDYKNLATFVSTLKPEFVPPQAYSTLARQMARENPQSGMAWADRLPPAQSATFAGEVFSEWRRSQPESALNWLSAQPANTRRAGFLENAIRSIIYEPHADAQLAALNATDRVTAEKLIASLPMAEDRRAEILSALKPATK